MKKNETECQPTLKEQFAALKRTNAAIRGQMGLQAKQVKDLKKCVSELIEERDARDKTIEDKNVRIGQLETRITELRAKYNDLDAKYLSYSERIEQYNNSPWYEKLFVAKV